ncbi:MAG: hypothetical protein ABIO76_07660 [Ginsengibacter sp.]
MMMNINKTNRSLFAIIIFLLLTNLVMLAFFVFLNKGANESSGNNEKGKFSTSLQKDVGFTQAQFDKYQALRKVQMEKVRPYFNEVRKAKFKFYDLLYTVPVTDSVLNNAAELIGTKQEELDIHIFRHFERVRGICTPDQLPRFDTALKKLIIRLISSKNKK